MKKKRTKPREQHSIRKYDQLATCKQLKIKVRIATSKKSEKTAYQEKPKKRKRVNKNHEESEYEPTVAWIYILIWHLEHENTQAQCPGTE